MRNLKSFAYLVVMALLVVYLLNPGAGVFEIIPDNIPFFGNLDEAAVVGLLLALWRKFRALRLEGKPETPAN